MPPPLDELVPPAVTESWHGRPLEGLYELYANLDDAIASWQRASGLGCPQGCGACCARYEPAVLPLEGMAVAAYVERTRNSTAVLEAASPQEGAGCVFNDPDSPLHCTVYPARPLECRLFAFSGVRDKHGEPLFRLCRDMSGPERRTLDASALRARYGVLPPLMPDYGARLHALGGAPAAPLREQARAAWSVVRYLVELGGRSSR
jgi:Fe-S-cluster containining protein